MMYSPLELEGLRALEAFHKVVLSTLDTEAEYHFVPVYVLEVMSLHAYAEHMLLYQSAAKVSPMLTPENNHSHPLFSVDYSELPQTKRF